MPSYLKLLITYLRPQFRRVVLLTTLLLGSIILQLLGPQLVARFIDRATGGEPMSLVLAAAALYVLVSLLQQLVGLGATYASETVAWTATNWLRADLAEHCLRLDLSFHKKHTPGEMIERLDGDVNQLANVFSQFTIQIAGNALLWIGVIVLMAQVDERMGLAMALISGFGLIFLLTLQYFITPLWAKAREADARYFSFLEERLGGLEDIQTSGAAAYTMNRFYDVAGQRLWTNLYARTANGFIIIQPIVLFALAYAAAFILGNTLFRNGAVTIGTIYLLFNYIEILSEPLWTIVQQVSDLQKARASLQRIQTLLAEKSRVLDEGDAPLSDGPLAVTFADVVFHYDDDPETVILEKVTFHLEPGRVLGLLGHTGSGKSTLIRLLLRFYDPTMGVICLGQVNLRQTRLTTLRERVALVSQEVQLFQATLRENITLFDATIPDERIVAVLHQLGLQSWFERLPDGLDMMVQAGGRGFSAGEAQLLALARVFLADPGVVILDEASSRLDPATERLLEGAIARLIEGRTAIIIAHRLGTVQRADEIMVLERGRVLEHGPRARLATDPTSHFAHLLQTGLEEALA